ncbi:transposase [Methylotuvimicrobium sp. KM2]|uniref:transposase n=1 Tax=Methylotuvimicrobium sp. KM2 TaxID=3133976 RepID=UPI003101276E
MTPEAHAALPKRITVRFFRLYGRTYMTTLLDARRYRKNALRKFYRHRWQIEIDLLFIKKVMQMEPLHCKTPAMARKELTVCLLAYNLIRLLMLQAGIRHHVWPCRISFTEALGSHKEFASRLAQATGEALLNWTNNVLGIVASKTIGEREARIEPRAVKRRPTNPFPYLSAPRAQNKEQLLAKRKADQIKGDLMLKQF